MNVAEMVRQLRVMLNDREEPYRISTDQLFIILNNAYMGIQLHSAKWKFLFKRGKFLTTVATKADYTLDRLYRVDDASVYAIKNGTTQRLPLLSKPYDTWVMEQTAGIEVAGVPLYLILTPLNKWKVNPTPTEVWTIYADYWLVPCPFKSLTSTPVWDSELHELVLFDAMKVAAALEPESKGSILMLATIRERYLSLKQAFNRKYLPSVVGAAPLL